MRRRESLRLDLAVELEEATWTADDISSRVNSIIRGGGGDDSDGSGGGGGGVDSGGDTQLLDAYFTAIADPPADDDGRRKSEGGTSNTRAPFPFSPTSQTSEACTSTSPATQDAKSPCPRLRNLQKSDLVEPESPAPRITRARTLTEDAGGHVDDHRFPSSSSTESLPSLHSSDEEDRGRSSTGSFTFSSARQQAKAFYLSQLSSSSSSHFPPLSGSAP